MRKKVAGSRSWRELLVELMVDDPDGVDDNTDDGVGEGDAGHSGSDGEDEGKNWNQVGAAVVWNLLADQHTRDAMFGRREGKDQQQGDEEEEVQEEQEQLVGALSKCWGTDSSGMAAGALVGGALLLSPTYVYSHSSSSTQGTCMLMCVHPKREKVRGRDREEEKHEIAGFG